MILNGAVPGLVPQRLAGVLTGVLAGVLAGVVAWRGSAVRDVVDGPAPAPPEEGAPIRIGEALRVAPGRNPHVNDSQIRIGVRGRILRLSGLVRSRPERDTADTGAAACRAPTARCTGPGIARRATGAAGWGAGKPPSGHRQADRPHPRKGHAPPREGRLPLANAGYRASETTAMWTLAPIAAIVPAMKAAGGWSGDAADHPACSGRASARRGIGAAGPDGLRRDRCGYPCPMTGRPGPTGRGGA